ncbi:hypothetical protein IE81DRAFT_75906 [Ceraceosorus guamensis]|uniref:Uncharacterized protein n=1 Tax=Ceraceosorus guamensis TaxID=1522189 RepID=A0A316W0M8_9BASI|nr:hypothetical protein IE81DRAFT_75906 [Ceraceosorus guamensis]PWN43477.1 hypothetical protein IE81DRAFT_75906 [Ceraceosorus guamensis]
MGHAWCTCSARTCCCYRLSPHCCRRSACTRTRTRTAARDGFEGEWDVYSFYMPKQASSPSLPPAAQVPHGARANRVQSYDPILQHARGPALPAWAALLLTLGFVFAVGAGFIWIQPATLTQQQQPPRQNTPGGGGGGGGSGAGSSSSPGNKGKERGKEEEDSKGANAFKTDKTKLDAAKEKIGQALSSLAAFDKVEPRQERQSAAAAAAGQKMTGQAHCEHCEHCTQLQAQAAGSSTGMQSQSAAVEGCTCKLCRICVKLGGGPKKANTANSSADASSSVSDEGGNKQKSSAKGKEKQSEQDEDKRKDKGEQKISDPEGQEQKEDKKEQKTLRSSTSAENMPTSTQTTKRTTVEEVQESQSSDGKSHKLITTIEVEEQPGRSGAPSSSFNNSSTKSDKSKGNSERKNEVRAGKEGQVESEIQTVPAIVIAPPLQADTRIEAVQIRQPGGGAAKRSDLLSARNKDEANAQLQKGSDKGSQSASSDDREEKQSGNSNDNGTANSGSANGNERQQDERQEGRGKKTRKEDFKEFKKEMKSAIVDLLTGSSSDAQVTTEAGEETQEKGTADSSKGKGTSLTKEALEAMSTRAEQATEAGERDEDLESVSLDGIDVRSQEAKDYFSHDSRRHAQELPMISEPPLAQPDIFPAVLVREDKSSSTENEENVQGLRPPRLPRPTLLSPPPPAAALPAVLITSSTRAAQEKSANGSSARISSATTSATNGDGSASSQSRSQSQQSEGSSTFSPAVLSETERRALMKRAKQRALLQAATEELVDRYPALAREGSAKVLDALDRLFVEQNTKIDSALVLPKRVAGNVSERRPNDPLVDALDGLRKWRLATQIEGDLSETVKPVALPSSSAAAAAASSTSALIDKVEQLTRESVEEVIQKASEAREKLQSVLQDGKGMMMKRNKRKKKKSVQFADEVENEEWSDNDRETRRRLRSAERAERRRRRKEEEEMQEAGEEEEEQEEEKEEEERAALKGKNKVTKSSLKNTNAQGEEAGEKQKLEKGTRRASRTSDKMEPVNLSDDSLRRIMNLTRQLQAA